jgi:hypothetical protein
MDYQTIGLIDYPTNYRQRAFQLSDLEIKNSMEVFGSPSPARPKRRGGR